MPARPWLALLLSLPLLLVGPAAVSDLVLLHSHGPLGLHEHQLAVAPVEDRSADELWHAGHHADLDHEHGSEDADAPVPTGVLIERPGSPWPRPTDGKSWLGCVSGATTALSTAVADVSLAGSGQIERPPGVCADRPVERSGALRVLRSSHALLI